MTWADYVNSAGIVAALIVSAYQTRKLVLDARQRDVDRRTERALELYRDLVVEGDTARAFEHLSLLLRNQGGRRFQQSTWLVLTDEAFAAGGFLDATKPENAGSYQDFYRILWFFERVESALSFGLVEPEVLFRTIGFHCWWWGQLLYGIRAPKASDALHKLAVEAAGWARAKGDYERWKQRCEKDFNGSAPVEL